MLKELEMKSIITSCKECYICNSPNVELHHIFFGTGNRKISDKYGLVVYLCSEHHRGQSGVHGGNRDLDLDLKRRGQRAFERKYSHKQFMELIKKNYLTSE